MAHFTDLLFAIPCYDSVRTVEGFWVVTFAKIEPQEHLRQVESAIRMQLTKP